MNNASEYVLVALTKSGKSSVKKFIVAILILLITLTLLVSNRHLVLLTLLSFTDTPLLIAKQDEGPRVRWHDDYYTIEWLDPQTVAIGEPLYYQQNINYLIIGEDRAVLFDAGSGLRKILPVVEQLTDKPITFVPSHFHYDHLGDGLPFDNIAVIDLPHISNRVTNNQLALQWHEHLGSVEGYTSPTFEVSEWLQPGHEMDLGDRKLIVLYTPGHTNDSISLYDSRTDILFSGDFIYQGDFFAFLPNSSLGDYDQGAKIVLATITRETSIYGAHRMRAPGTPIVNITNVQDLKQALDDIRNGSLKSEGFYPVTYRVSDEINLLAEPWYLQSWKVSYPNPGSTGNQQ
ncbi:MAG: MBL fold metallo-hydrolase [bacterium]